MSERWKVERIGPLERVPEGWEPFAVTTSPSPFGGTVTIWIRKPPDAD